MNKRRVLIIIIVVLIVILSTSILLNVGKKSKYSDYNNYKIVRKAVDLPGTYVRQVGNLASSHCLDDICITNVSIHYTGMSGRIDYTIVNNSKKSKNGYMKMVFDDVYLVVPYNLKKGKKTEGSIQYDNTDLSNVYDYKLKKLSNKELSNIKKK